MLMLLGQLWALPLTLIGAIAALVGGVRVLGVQGGAIVCAAKTGGLIAKVFAATNTYGAGGFYGAFVFFHSATPSPAMLKHELRHFAQARVLGPLWPLLYGLHFLWGLVTTRSVKDAYLNVFLERDARAAEAK